MKISLIHNAAPTPIRDDLQSECDKLTDDIEETLDAIGDLMVKSDALSRKLATCRAQTLLEAALIARKYQTNSGNAIASTLEEMAAAKETEDAL